MQRAEKGEISNSSATHMVREKTEEYKSDIAANNKFCEEELKEAISTVNQI